MFIYKITNLINNKIYIGQTSKDIKFRFNLHIRNSKKESYRRKQPIDMAIYKYGINNFEIKFVLGKSIDNDNEINIQTRRTTRSSGERTKSLKFNEGDNIIHSKEDEQSLLFIISCLMNGVAELVTYYYNNKKL